MVMSKVLGKFSPLPRRGWGWVFIDRKNPEGVAIQKEWIKSKY
jgi:hypothetical protein